MNDQIAFVYVKDGKAKVLAHDSAERNHSELIISGWMHTATIDPCGYIEDLINCRYPKKQLKRLKERPGK